MKKGLDAITYSDYLKIENITPRKFYLRYKNELEDFVLRVAKDFNIEKAANIKFAKKTNDNKNIAGRYFCPSTIYIYLQQIIEKCFSNYHICQNSFRYCIDKIKSRIIITLLHEFGHLNQYVNYNKIFLTNISIDELESKKEKYIEAPNRKMIYVFILNNLNYILNKYNIDRSVFLSVLENYYYDMYSNIKYRRISGFGIFKRILKMYRYYNNDMKEFFHENILGEKYYNTNLEVTVGSTKYLVKIGKYWDSGDLQKLTNRLDRDFYTKRRVPIKFAVYSNKS